MKVQLMRLSSVLACTGDSRSSHYRKIIDGVMVPPVPTGVRTSRYPDDEVQLVVSARIAGASDVELRHLVADLLARRKSRLVASNHEGNRS